VVRYGPPETPDPGDQAIYADNYAQFAALYPALKAVRPHL
jgi:hypothetical protein